MLDPLTTAILEFFLLTSMDSLCSCETIFNGIHFRSASMACTDRLPLPDTPSTTRIVQSANNRLGAVYSSLHAFWRARSAAAGNARRDAYSAIFHDTQVTTCFMNDLTSNPDQLLQHLLPIKPSNGNNFNVALKAAKRVMERFWNSER